MFADEQTTKVLIDNGGGPPALDGACGKRLVAFDCLAGLVGGASLSLNGLKTLG